MRRRGYAYQKPKRSNFRNLLSTNGISWLEDGIESVWAQGSRTHLANKAFSACGRSGRLADVGRHVGYICTIFSGLSKLATR